MNFTRLLMSASAVVLGMLGIIGTFFPDELLSQLGVLGPPSLILSFQVMGALYLGFAALNWMARENLIGGIYSRPVAIGNLLHFLTAGLALIKFLASWPEHPAVWVLAVVYAVFALSFGAVLVRHPIRSSSQRG